MRCKYCGNKVDDSAVFCNRCGGSVGTGVSAVKPRFMDDDFRFNVRPVFAPGLVFLRVFPPCFLVAAFLTYVFGTIVSLSMDFLSLPYGFSAYYFIGVIAFFFICIVPLYTLYKNVSATKFSFFIDRFEYTDNALAKQPTVVEYGTILDSNVTKGPMQKTYNFGTIRFVAVGSTHDFIAKIRDVRDPDIVYRKIIALMENDR